MPVRRHRAERGPGCAPGAGGALRRRLPKWRWRRRPAEWRRPDLAPRLKESARRAAEGSRRNRLRLLPPLRQAARGGRGERREGRLGARVSFRAGPLRQTRPHCACARAGHAGKARPGRLRAAARPEGSPEGGAGGSAPLPQPQQPRGVLGGVTIIKGAKLESVWSFYLHGPSRLCTRSLFWEG